MTLTDILAGTTITSLIGLAVAVVNIWYYRDRCKYILHDNRFWMDECAKCYQQVSDRTRDIQTAMANSSFLINKFEKAREMLQEQQNKFPCTECKLHDCGDDCECPCHDNYGMDAESTIEQVIEFMSGDIYKEKERKDV